MFVFSGFDGFREQGNTRRSAMDIIKVAATSRSTAVAGAIAGIMREREQVDVQAIGAGAVNQATKAIIIARGYLELDGIDIVCVPSFVEVMIDNQERTAVRLSIEKRSVQPGISTVKEEAGYEF
jgi:stage V sporulation protein S